MTERERSDRYWESVTDFDVYSLTYGSLPDITRNVHLIVLGTVTSLQDGEIKPFEGKRPRQTRFGVVRIDEVLRGTPQVKLAGTILVADLGLVTTTDEDLPNDGVILFLMNYAQMRSDAGFAPSSDPDDGYYYARPNGYQGVLRNLDGLVDLVDGPPDWEVHFGPYPAQLDGDPFDAVLDRVRALGRA